MRTATLHDNDKTLIKIQFDYDPDLVGKIKNNVPGRRWDPKMRVWLAPNSVSLANFLRQNNFEFADTLLEKQTRHDTKEMKIPLPKGMYPFQKIGTETVITKFENRALIADAPGLGKTVQAIGWLYAQPKMRPALVICPATAKIVWERHMKKWLAEDYATLSGMGAKEQLPRKPNVVIVNYDILQLARRTPGETDDQFKERKAGSEFLHHALKGIKFQALILDESHYIGNPKALRTKIVRSIAKGIENILCLSGTPVTSRPSQFFPTLNTLRQDLFPSFWSYAQRYCGARNNGFGWDFSGASHMDELNTLLKDNLMIRRAKEDVIAELPPKTRSLVPLEIDNRKTYDQAKRDFIAWLEKTEGKDKARKAENAQGLVQIEALKQLCLSGKKKAVVSWIAGFIEGGNKLVVFTHHTEFRHALYEHFKDIAVEAKGGADNQAAADSFQNDPNILLFFGGIKSANVAITLTAASHMAVVELPWTPGDLEQAEDRIYARVNDMHGANIYLLVAVDTIEEEIAAILDDKMQNLTHLLNGKEVEESSMLTELISKYRKKGGSSRGKNNHKPRP